MSDPSYTSKAEKYFTETRPEMLSFIPPQARTILEIGCGEGGFAESAMKTMGMVPTVIEPHAPAAEEARKRLPRVYTGTFDEVRSEIQGEFFDCIVMNDVLEHLADPWSMLRSLSPFLSPAGRIISSIPNVRHLPVLKELLLQSDWHYRPSGVMDSTHLRFFTHKSIRRMFVDAGYDIERIEGINPIAFPWKFGLLNWLTGGALEDCRYVQFACVARPREISI